MKFARFRGPRDTSKSRSFHPISIRNSIGSWINSRGWDGMKRAERRDKTRLKNAGKEEQKRNEC